MTETRRAAALWCFRVREVALHIIVFVLGFGPVLAHRI
jgi:hypothetical protein